MTIDDIQAALGYFFQQPQLLGEALTHSSALPVHNERLEFLGDALLGLAIADQLFQRYPHATEGDLTRLRASLVNGNMLAELARELSLGETLRLGQGAIKKKEDQRASVLSGALEAVFGAVYLDGGFSAACEVILRLYREKIAALQSVDALKDPKTRLQEYLQAHQQPLPQYTVVETTGEPHQRTFSVACIAGDVHAIAVGKSRRIAEQNAAQHVFAQLQGALSL